MNTLMLAAVLTIVVLATAAASIEIAHAQDPRELTVVVNDVKIKDLEKSQLVRVELNVLNGGDEEVILSGEEIDLLDEDLKQYGSTSGYSFLDRGENISSNMCDIIIFESINPGISIDIKLCFEVPKDTRYDSVVFYENMFMKDVDTAKVIPLVEDSVGYSVLVQGVKHEDQAIVDRAEEIESGGCLIATAAYGTELVSEVQNLREIRNRAYTTDAGGGIMYAVNDFYYTFSPTVADWERKNPMFKEAVRTLITPLMASFAMLDHTDMSTDGELLGYVALVGALNVGVYIVTPIFAIFATKKLIGMWVLGQ